MFDLKTKREAIAVLLKAGRQDLAQEVMALKPTNVPAPVADALNALQTAKKMRYPGSTIQNLFREFQNVCKQYHVDPQRLLSMAAVNVVAKLNANLKAAQQDLNLFFSHWAKGDKEMAMNKLGMALFDINRGISFELSGVKGRGPLKQAADQIMEQFR